jgi:hypothetical protein
MARVVISKNLRQLIEPQILPVLADTADKLAADARAYARSVAWGPGSGGTHYANEIVSSSAMIRGRARGFVTARKFTSRFLEGGTSRMPARHVLETFARNSGYRYRKARSR